MNNKTVLSSLYLMILLMVSLTSFAQQPYPGGMPSAFVLSAAEMNAINSNPNGWLKMTFGPYKNWTTGAYNVNNFNGITTSASAVSHPFNTPTPATGSSPTHAVIELPAGQTTDVLTAEQHTCMVIAGTHISPQLKCMPAQSDIEAAYAYDPAVHGTFKVMRLNDSQKNTPHLSSQITYAFTPTDTANMIQIAVAFVIEVPHAKASDNPVFCVEIMQNNGQLITTPSGNLKDSYFLVNMADVTQSGWEFNPNTTKPQYVNNVYPGSADPNFALCEEVDTWGVTRRYIWMRWVTTIFDLRNHIGQALKMRITTNDCKQTGHWGYAFFTAYSINGNMRVIGCNNSATLNLTAPRGFASYAWYRVCSNGSKENMNNSNQEILNMPQEGVNVVGYECRMVSGTGIQLTLSAFITSYEIVPSFNYTFVPDSCKYKIAFTNTSSIMKYTTEETSREGIQNVKWYFGDGDSSTAVHPVHTYPGPGDYLVRMIVSDSLCNCTETSPETNTSFIVHIPELISPSNTLEINACIQTGFSVTVGNRIFTAACENEPVVFPRVTPQGCDSTIYVTIIDKTEIPSGYDTVQVCKEHFPFTYDNNHYYRNPGTYQILYKNASMTIFGKDTVLCDSVCNLTLIEITPLVFIEQEGDFCDQFITTFIAKPQSTPPVYEWNTGSNLDRIVVEVPGKYAVTITDTLGCKAKNEVLLSACLPFMQLPNSITPSDQNDLNDYFSIPQSALIKELELTIYDRYGNVVYHSTDPNLRWDGRVNGKIMYNQTFNYILYVTDFNGNINRYKGSLLVL